MYIILTPHEYYMVLPAVAINAVFPKDLVIYTVRYIDDLLTLNNNSFEEEIINIYPPELTLKRTIY